MEAVIIYLKILAVILLLWPRGYLLIYLIDRSKSFGFGFKIFAGWLLALSGLTCDVFSANVFGGTRLLPWVFLLNSVSQIFGFGFMIFLFERKIPWPKTYKLLKSAEERIIDFFSWDKMDRIAMGVLLFVVLVQLGLGASRINNFPVYGFDSFSNFNYQAKTIYYLKDISLEPKSPFYLGGGERVEALNDALLKDWFAITSGHFFDRQINYTSLLYYLLLIIIFFSLLPSDSPLHYRFLGTTMIALLPPLIFTRDEIPSADWLLGLFLMLCFVSFWYYLRGKGNSFYYFSGISLAFACWTSLEALLFVFPIMFAVKTATLMLRKVSLKDYLLDWFFAWLTIAGWITFILWYRPDIFRYDINYLLVQLVPALILFLVLGANTLVSYIRKISSV